MATSPEAGVSERRQAMRFGVRSQRRPAGIEKTGALIERRPVDSRSHDAYQQAPRRAR